MSQLGTAEELAAVYAAVIETALDSVIVADERGRVIALNPAAVATFGFSLDEAIGQDIGTLIVPPHLRHAHTEGMRRYRETGTGRVLGQRIEMEALRRDGSTIPVELAITEVRLHDRRLFTANLRDLSATHAALAEIEAQREALQQSEKLSAIGSLLASVAHELNNPLTIALGEATLLLSDIDDEETAVVAGRARRILAATERCASVVRSFLAIARRRKTERQRLWIAPMVETAIGLLAHGAATGGVTLRCDTLDDLPEVFADPDQVQQIIVNLVVNAIQALDGVEGPREVRFSAEASGKFLHLRVADTGPGVPADIDARIFQPFFTTKPLGVGTGIGLAVSRDLANRQGGRLELLAHQSKGAIFQLSLPLARVGQADARPDAPDPDRADRPLRILIVDDEPEIAALLAEGIGRFGHRCTIAVGGLTAQEIITSGNRDWDCLVCDLRMPQLDGPTLYRWLTAGQPDLARRMVFVTGDALGSAAAEFLAGTGQPVLEKPFTPEDLERVIRKMQGGNS